MIKNISKNIAKNRYPKKGPTRNLKTFLEAPLFLEIMEACYSDWNLCKVCLKT